MTAARDAVWVRSVAVLHPRSAGVGGLAAAARDPLPPGGEPLRVPGPDLSVLGERGLRHLDRASVLLLVALEAVIPATVSAGVPRDRIGVFYGTALGGLGSIAGFARDAVCPDPLAANPGQFQGTVLNAPLGRAMIRHGLVGSTATFSTAGIASADALAAGVEAISGGRLARALCGGYEGIEEAVVAGARATGLSGPDLPPLAEGVATLVLAADPPEGGPGLVLRAVETAAAPRGLAGAGRRAADLATRRAGWGEGPVPLVVVAGPGAPALVRAWPEAWDVGPGLGSALGADAALAALVLVDALVRGDATRGLAVVEGCGNGAAIAIERA